MRENKFLNKLPFMMQEWKGRKQKCPEITVIGTQNAESTLAQFIPAKLIVSPPRDVPKTQSRDGPYLSMPVGASH